MAIHIKCNKINLQTYKCLQYNYSTAWYFLNCFQQIIPFSNITNKELLEINQGKNIKFKAITKKPPSSEHSLIDHLNRAMDDPDSALNCNKYFEPNEMTNLMVDHSKSLSFFHLNISSLPFHFEEFSTLLSENKLHFDILGILESRLKSDKAPITSIQLPNYNTEYKTTQSSNGGTLLCIKKASSTNLEKIFKYIKPNNYNLHSLKLRKTTKVFL